MTSDYRISWTGETTAVTAAVDRFGEVVGLATLSVLWTTLLDLSLMRIQVLILSWSGWFVERRFWLQDQTTLSTHDVFQLAAGAQRSAETTGKVPVLIIGNINWFARDHQDFPRSMMLWAEERIAKVVYVCSPMQGKSSWSHCGSSVEIEDVAFPKERDFWEDCRKLCLWTCGRKIIYTQRWEIEKCTCMLGFTQRFWRRASGASFKFRWGDGHFFSYSPKAFEESFLRARVFSRDCKSFFGSINYSWISECCKFLIHNSKECCEKSTNLVAASETVDVYE